MGKHKKEKKSKKNKKEKKHKKDKKRHDTSSSENSSGAEEEVLWCDGTETQKKDAKPLKEQKKEAPKQSENNDDWLGFFERTTADNAKQGNVDRQQRKDQVAKAENKMRYSRELNSYFKDEKKGEYIEDPEEFYKNKKKQEKEYSSSSASDDESDEEPNNPSDSDTESSKPLTDVEKNALTAKLIKAEMLGDDDLVKKLKAKLDSASDATSKKTKVEVYTKKASKSGDKPESSEDKLSVRELYYRTKSMSARDETMRFVSSSSKLKRVDDEYDEVKSKKKKQKTDKPQYERQNSNDSRCRQCLEETDSRLIVKFHSEFESCFAALSPYETFVPNVIQIRSRDHSFRCSLDADEDCWSEIRKVMRNISAFFDKFHQQTVIFMESNFRNQKAAQNLSRRHFVIECIPLKRRYADDARIYFHKAIMDCEEEWSQNKKLIKLEEKCITAKLPKGLPYFWVSFGPNFNGFAHVIEDENHFPTQFGNEIIAGLLDIDCSKWNKSHRGEKSSTNHRFSKEWREFSASSA